MTDVLNKKKSESFTDYHIRLFENKDEYGIDKYKIADLLNKEFGTSYDESKWRKDYAQFLKWKDYLVKQNLDDEIVKKHEELRIESQKEKIRKQDQKREYTKLIRNSARFEKIRDDIIKGVSELENKKPLTFEDNNFFSSDKEGLVLFSDWHFGMNVDNSFNKYNKDIFNERVEKLVNKTIEYGKRNEINTLHIAQLGDLISGSIHVSTRVQSNEDLIEQIQYVSETLAEVIAKLANEFNEIKYYNVIGNHGRAGHKNDVGIKENFEYLVTWYLEARLKGFNNVDLVSDDDGMILAQIKNQKIVFVHGNYDRVDNVAKNLPQMLGYVPNLIISGHIHHNYEKEHGMTTVITNGSLIGADDYATQKRYMAKPSQRFLVFDENEGLECTYTIKF